LAPLYFHPSPAPANPFPFGTGGRFVPVAGPQALIYPAHPPDGDLKNRFKDEQPRNKKQILKDRPLTVMIFMALKP
jgi:hypothetical protein